MGYIIENYKKIHPFDLRYGVKTSEHIAAKHIAPTPEFSEKMIDYEPVQPSVVRQSINLLRIPSTLKEYDFIDLGCGKGRATIVASEFPFNQVMGVEISSRLASIARENAKIISNRYPNRPNIEIIEGNAVDFPASNKKVILFLYNPFVPELVDQLARNIEQKFENDIQHMFVIYHNPVGSLIFDSSDYLQRWHAVQLESEDSEKGYGYDTEGVTAIWQSKHNATPTPYTDANRRIYDNGTYPYFRQT
jgi:SAM-dependent methyltransferase